MTREMNKPDWQNKRINIYYDKTVKCKECVNEGCQFKQHIKKTDNFSVVCEHYKRERILNPDIADFFWATVERYKK